MGGRRNRGGRRSRGRDKSTAMVAVRTKGSAEHYRMHWYGKGGRIVAWPSMSINGSCWDQYKDQEGSDDEGCPRRRPAKGVRHVNTATASVLFYQPDYCTKLKQATRDMVG